LRLAFISTSFEVDRELTRLDQAPILYKMAARTAAVSTSRVILARSARTTPISKKSTPIVSLHTSATRYNATSAARADDAQIPGATYVHIPPLEIPAEGLVPSQGSAQLRVVCGNGPTLTVAHSLAIVKTIEAKCGPVVSAHHRRVSRALVTSRFDFAYLAVTGSRQWHSS
jgi:hypothetical protein